MVATVGLLGLTSIINNYGPTFAQAAPASIAAYGPPATVRRAVTALEKREDCFINVQCLLTPCNHDEVAVYDAVQAQCVCVYHSQ